MKNTTENTTTESNQLPNKPRSLRPIPSLLAQKSLKPKTKLVRPVKVLKGPAVG